MKYVKITSIMLSAAILVGSCGTLNNTAKGGIIGGGSGTVAGAAIGGLIGKGKGAAIGAAIGAVVGTGAGVVIGRKMDKKAEEAARIEGAEVEKVTDTNGLAAVKVSFTSGILFGFNSSALAPTIVPRSALACSKSRIFSILPLNALNPPRITIHAAEIFKKAF